MNLHVGSTAHFPVTGVAVFRRNYEEGEHQLTTYGVSPANPMLLLRLQFAAGNAACS